MFLAIAELIGSDFKPYFNEVFNYLLEMIKIHEKDEYKFKITKN